MKILDIPVEESSKREARKRHPNTVLYWGPLPVLGARGKLQCEDQT